MGGGGQQVVREALRAGLAGRVEGLQRGAEALRVEAHVVAREQHRRAVAGGVLHGLGRRRGGELLEARHHLPAQPALGQGHGPQRFAAEPALQVVEQRAVGVAQFCAGRVEGLAEQSLVLGGAAAGVDVGAVDAELADQRVQRPADAAEGQVAGRQVAARHLQQGLGEVLQVAGEVAAEDQFAGLADLVEEARRTPAGFAPQAAQLQLAEGRVLQQRHLVHEFVTSGAVHLPVAGQRLVGAEDLLHVEGKGCSARPAGRCAASRCTRRRRRRQ